MDTKVIDKDDLKFRDFSNILISGCSQSGKTHFTKNLLMNANDMFITPPNVCIFLYSHWQKAYEEIQNKWGEKITFLRDTPDESFVAETMEGKKHGLFVVDDKVAEVVNATFFSDLLTRMAHHYRLSNCILVQDPSLTGKMKSVLARNIHVNVLMRSPRDRNYLRSLAIMLNDYKCVTESYDDACAHQYGYLVLDLHPQAKDQVKYRSQIFPNDDCCLIYQAKKK